MARERAARRPILRHMEAPEPAAPPEPSFVAEKRRIRGEVRRRRRSLSPEQRLAAAAGLAEHLARLVRETGARSLSCYLAMPGEPDTAAFLEWATGTGLDVLLPKSLEGHRLGWIRPDGRGTVVGAHGISEPIGELLPGTAVGDVDLMLIPASAVDLRGMRMGWGLGYYDRCIASLERRPPIFAIVHDDEVLPEIPAEPHDSPVDGAVTPSRVIRFAPRG